MAIFGFPLAFWALSSLPVLGAIYWLRNRYRNVTVSSLLLWDQCSLAREGGRKFQRIQTALLFYLELAILSLTALAATAPLFPLGGKVRHLVVVLDDSWSMQAVNDGKSFRQAGLEKVMDEFLAYRHTRATVILAGHTVRQAGSHISSKAELIQAMDQWRCQSDRVDWAQAITLSTGLAQGWTDILVISDHYPAVEPQGNSGILWHAVGSEVSNLAITGAFLSQTDTGQRLVVEVSNLSGQDTRSALTVGVENEDPAKGISRQPVELSAHSVKRLVLSLPDSDKPVGVQLKGQRTDGLSVDDDVVLIPFVRKKLPVTVALTNTDVIQYLIPALDASELCSMGVDSPELVITDNSTQLGQSTGPWRLCILNESDAVPINGPYLTDASSPLLEGTQFKQVVWGAARIEESAGDAQTSHPAYQGRPLIMAGDVPLLTEYVRRDGRLDFLMRWNPDYSNLQNDINFPIMITNCIRMCIASRPGPQRPNYAVGDIIDLNLPEGAARIVVSNPSGKQSEYDLAQYDSRQFSLSAEEKGIYQFSLYDAEGKERIYPVAANCLARSESDLNECSKGEVGGWQVETQADAVYQKGSWLLVLAALVLLALHHVLMARGRVRQ